MLGSNKKKEIICFKFRFKFWLLTLIFLRQKNGYMTGDLAWSSVHIERKTLGPIDSIIVVCDYPWNEKRDHAWMVEDKIDELKSLIKDDV